MHRLKLFFVVLLLILALPVWRFIDLTVIIWPHPVLLSIFQTLWASIFLALPVKLLKPSLPPLRLLITLGVLSLGFWYAGPLSDMATIRPEFSHCGRLTYTGFIYPARSLLSDTHQDDLEARNQLCWVRKMVLRLPMKFDSTQEFEDFEKLIQQKLLKPEIKYRVSLPLIAVLYGSIGMTLGEIKGGHTFVKSLHFWREQYTVEISGRDYSVWNWPHSSYMKFEYGLVERNWENLIESMVIEIN
ncbi:MAG TPA: hypothetical protein VNJ01_09005 [Bacteriovoracaceae bacterium]|nr:hypothetical protein [Bacteriovoracaceae bacterium]